MVTIGFTQQPDEPASVAAVELSPGIRAKRHAAWQTANGMLGPLKPTPTDVLNLAVFLSGLDDPEEDEEDEPDEDEDDEAPGFSAVDLIDRFPPVRLLRRLLA